MQVPEGYRDLEPLAGGYAAETFTARSQATGEVVVVRLFGVGDRRRGPEAAGLQAAAMQLVRGLVPVPDVVEWRPGLLVTRLVPGAQLGELMPAMDPAALAAVGTHLGEILGRLANVAALGAGCYLDEKLSYGPWEPGSESLVTWLDAMSERPGSLPWGQEERAALRELCAGGDDLLARHHRAVHSHGDLTTRNVLVHGDRVTALLDWEFTHPGHPLEDLGRLLRQHPRGRFADAVLDAFVPWLPEPERTDRDTLRERARAADLYGLLENGTRRGGGTNDEARRLLLAMARTRSLLPPP